MRAEGFQLSFWSYLSQAANKIHATILGMIFQVMALQLAAAISAVCFPIMVLNTALPILGFSPILKVKVHTKDKTASNTVAVTATSSSRQESAHRHSKPGVVQAAWGNYFANGTYQRLTDHEAGWLKAYYQRNVEFWRPCQIEPDASKSTEYQKKLDLVVTERSAQKCDMASLSFAKFVCQQKGLRYTGLNCDSVMITGEFLQLDPPEFCLDDKPL